MNVLVVTQMYKLPSDSTAIPDNNAVHHLIKYWVSYGHRVIVFFSYRNPAWNIQRVFSKWIHKEASFIEYSIEGINVIMCETQLLPKQTMLKHFQLTKLDNLLKQKLKSIKFEPQVIINHIPTANNLKVGTFPNAKYYAILHGADMRHMMKDSRKYLEELQKYDYCICRSDILFKFFNQYKIRLSDFILYSGIPGSCLGKNNIKEFYNDQPHRILFVGKLNEQKRILLLIRSVKNIFTQYKITLTIIGTGKKLYVNRIKRFIKINNMVKHVSLVGTVDRNQVLAFMRNHDIFVLPSKNETLGIVYLEAMSMGCLTIGTKNEGIDGIIKSGYNGWLVDSDDLDSLTKMLIHVIELPHTIKQEISRRAIETMGSYNEEDISKRYLDYIQKTLSH